MTTNGIIGVLPTLQSAALLGHNLQYMNKKKKNVKGLVGLRVTNIVGVSMIKETSNIINGL